MADEPLPDMMDEALEQNRRQFLPAKEPTATSSSAIAQAWVDDVVQVVRLMLLQDEISDWTHDHEHRLEVLKAHFPDQYDELCSELFAAEQNAKSLRF